MKLRSIIVNFSFKVNSCTWSSMWHAVIIWLFGKIFENFVFSSLPFFMCFYICFVIILIFSNFDLSVQIIDTIEKITLCFVLSLYDKNRFILTIYFYIIYLVLYSWNLFFPVVGKKSFFLHSWSNNQLSCGILRKILTMRAGDYERINNYDWPKA